MARLRKCKSCGNMVAKDAKRCQQCGGRVNKSHGCALFVIFIVLVFIGTCVSTSNSKSGHDVAQNPNSPENADAFQVDVFSNDGALICVQNFLEEKINSVVNVRIKFTGIANIQKLSDVIPEFVDSMQANKDKIGTSINAKNVWSIEQEFCDKDNPSEKFSYYALVEFAKGKGYRVIFLSVGDNQIWPVVYK